MKKILSFLIAVAVVFSLAQPCTESSNVIAAPKGIRLNVKKKTIQKGKTFVIKCKGSTQKVRWSISNKKVVKGIKKGKNSIRIKGKAWRSLLGTEPIMPRMVRRQNRANISVAMPVRLRRLTKSSCFQKENMSV